MDEKPFESLNVIPFVDIMLVLLTMVLTTATFVAVRRIPITLPQASPMKVEQQKETIIEIAVGGSIHLDGAQLSKEALEARLKDMPKDTNFLIRADKSIPFQAFVDVADALKRGAFTKVGVRTQSVGASRTDWAGVMAPAHLQHDGTSPATAGSADMHAMPPPVEPAPMQDARPVNFTFSHAIAASLALHGAIALPFVMLGRALRRIEAAAD